MDKQKKKHKLVDNWKYPYQNKFLIDLPGEIWKPFPVAPYNECFEISNKGRVKRQARVFQRADGITTQLPARIITQSERYYLNRFLKDKTYNLVCKVGWGGQRRGFSITRLVYYAFVEPFDLDNPNIYVRNKDGDGFNCMPENLYLFERRKMTRWLLDHERKSILSGVSDRSKFSKEEIQGWIDAQKKTVNQYDLQGKLLQTFNSRMDAAKSIGVNSTCISAVLRGKTPSAGGFLWREGSENAPFIKVRKIRSPVRVAQYSFEGKLLRVFSSIKEASLNMNVSEGVVADRIYGRSNHYGSIVQLVDETKEIPDQFEGKLPEPKEFDKAAFCIPEGKKYPFQNLSLEDIPGEVWKEIPETDGIFKISNYGRAKTEDQSIEYSEGKSFIKAGKILRQSISKRTSFHRLYFRYRTKQQLINVQTASLVYKQFKADYPDNYTIVHKDNDPLNCRIDNLELKHLSDLFKQYLLEGRLKGGRKKPIAQYTMEGTWIASYTSVTEAAEKIDYCFKKISNCANGRTKHAKGFVWKYIKDSDDNF